MVVQPLGRQHLRQLALVPGRLLDLGPLVLEPDLDLALVQPQLLREVLAPLLRQVAVVLKLLPQPAQLLRGEGRAWPLVLGGLWERVGDLVGLLHFSQSGTCNTK